MSEHETTTELDPDRRFSESSISAVLNPGFKSGLCAHNNDTVQYVTLYSPGIVKIRCIDNDKKMRPIVLSGGMHGDERAGIVILDKLFKNIIDGSLPVGRDVVLIFGNLIAMSENGGKGVRCTEEEVGVTSNLNRCFGGDFFESPRCYSESRANEILTFFRNEGSNLGAFEAIDIHQSFKVPYVSDVREDSDRTEYTYAMLYPHGDDGIDEALKWIHKSYSDIVAGAVLNDMSVHHSTFAGFLAREFGANAATFEQGTIGNTDWATFTPQLFENLSRKVSGVQHIERPLGFNTWKCVGGIIRTQEDFSFLNENGDDIDEAPTDFVPILYELIARDGTCYRGLHPGERILFGNAKVPIGDRAAAVITEFVTNAVPGPEDYFDQ